MGVLGKIFKVALHPITAMVVRSIPEALDLAITWLENKKDGLTDEEKKEIRTKVDALTKSLLGI